MIKEEQVTPASFTVYNFKAIMSYGSLLLALCFLATGGIFVKLSELEPITTGFYRVLFALPILYVYLKCTEAKKTEANSIVSTKDRIIVLVSGVFLGLDLALWNISFHYTTVANANLLANLVPIIVVPLSYFILKTKITKGFLLGSLVTLVGVFILMSGKISPSPENIKGDLLALGTALFYGLYLFIIGFLRSKYNTGTLMLWSSAGSLLTLLPIALVMENSLIPKSLTGIAVLVALALISHVGGQGLLAYAMGHIKSTLSSVLVLLQPVIAGLYALVIFNEILGPLEVIGMGVTLGGIYLTKRNS